MPNPALVAQMAKLRMASQAAPAVATATPGLMAMAPGGMPPTGPPTPQMATPGPAAGRDAMAAQLAKRRLQIGRRAAMGTPPAPPAPGS